MVVVLPAPLGPSSPKISRSSMPKDTPSTAWKPLKDLERFVTDRKGGMGWPDCVDCGGL